MLTPVPHSATGSRILATLDGVVEQCLGLGQRQFDAHRAPAHLTQLLTRSPLSSGALSGPFRYGLMYVGRRFEYAGPNA